MDALERILNPRQILTVDLGQTICKIRLPNTSRSVPGSDLMLQSAINPWFLGIKSILNRLHLGKLTYTLIAIERLCFLEPVNLAPSSG